MKIHNYRQKFKHCSNVSCHIYRSRVRSLLRHTIRTCVFSVFTFVLRDFLHQLVVLGLLPLQVVFDHGLPDDSRSLVLTRHLNRGTNIN